ncbi:MAG: hypothetical protein J6W52_00245 [Bacteroidaceae bacterium]|nr:hypothetical protein [Bacteroidaceae bacterium]
MSLRMIFVLSLTFYATRAILDILGEIDYGVYNTVCGFVSLFSFLNMSVANGIQRFYNFELDRNGVKGACRVYNTALRIQLIAALLLFFIIEVIGIWYIRHKLVCPADRLDAAMWAFHFSVIGFVLTILQAPYSAAIMAREKMDFYALVSVLDAFLKLGIVFLLPFISYDNLATYAALFASINLLNFLLYASYAKWNFPEIMFKKLIELRLLRSMVCFSGWNIFGSFSGIMKEQGINLIINFFCGPIVNAARALAAQVNAGLMAFVSNIIIPVRPQVIQSYANQNYDRTLRLTYGVSRITSCVIVLITLPIILDTHFILNLWLKSIPIYTDTFVIIVILISFVNNLNSAVSGVIHASGQMMLYQTVSSSVSLMCIPTAYLLLKYGFSPNYALLMVLLWTTLSQYVSLLIMKRVINFTLTSYAQEVLWPLLKMMTCTIIIPLTIRLSMEEGWLRFLLIGTTSVLMTILCSYQFTMQTSEKEMLKEYLKKYGRKRL